MATRINGYALAALGAGVLFFWSGLTGKSVLASLQSVIKGQSPQGNPPVNAPANSGATGDTSSPVSPTGYTGGGSPSQNQTLGKLIASGFGWGSGQQWNDLVSLWDRESGWNNKAQNPSSGAYGIPQALPYTKMPKAAWPESAGGSSSAADQIMWGLNYIQQRYGSPSAAWAHEQANGWY
jgi:hypothetical protein